MVISCYRRREYGEINCYMKKNFKKEIELIISALQEAGYNPYEQLYGYLKTGDDTYITRNCNAREMISKLDREQIREYIAPYIKRNSI